MQKPLVVCVNAERLFFYIKNCLYFVNRHFKTELKSFILKYQIVQTKFELI